MLEKLFESIFSKVGEKLVDYGVDTVKGNDSKFILETLERNLKSLSAKASDIDEQIKNGELSGKRKRKREIENWLKDVKIIESKFLELENEVQEEGFISRFFGGDQATKLNARVDELVEQSRHFCELLLDAYETRAEPLLTTKLFGEAFEKNVEKIWKCVVIDRIPIVGIYGMGGVGKTTLAKYIYNLLLEKTKFHVYWVTVAREFSINKLQDDIANVIGLNLSTQNDEDKRAALLNRAISQIKDFVLILDDVWDNISLIKVGVSHHLEGCRLIITTRSLEVCRRIGCRENISVQTLCRNEAWSLFKEILGLETTLTPEVEEIAKSVAKECDGLPLGIVTLAVTMRGVTDIHVWKNTFAELNESLLGQDDMEDKVFRVLKYSFDRLDPNYSTREDQIMNGFTKLQLCFLYCSLYPEDFRISKHELIIRFISEGLMDRRKRREAEFDQGHAILDKLVNLCLLESTRVYDEHDGVKMHDLVRDMALKITRDNPKFKVLAGLSLNEIPSEEEYWTEDLEKMSLMHNDIREIPKEMSPNCPKLSTLLMNWNMKLTIIPDSFFSLMSGLCVLNLSHTSVISLPNSLSDLKILNSLILNDCHQLVCVPNLGKLKALRELDLTRTKITQVPQGMENLVNLKYLSLLTWELKMLPAGLLPIFKYLQYLLLPIQIQVVVEEIESLKQLENFSCRVKDVNDFNRIIRQSGQRNITSFDIVIGEYKRYLQLELAVGVEIDYKRVIFSGCNLKKGEEKDTTLVAKDIQGLQFYHCEDLSNCFSNDLQRFSSSRSIMTLLVSDCKGIECIARLTTTQLMIMVQEELKALEEINLHCLPDFIGIVVIEREIEGHVVAAVKAPPPSLGVFSSLKRLKIGQCHKIKNLGLPVQDLQNLEEMNIEWCDEIEEIIQVVDQGRGGMVSLPKLKELHLSDLPKLKSICQETKLRCSSIENIRLRRCPKLKKLPLLCMDQLHSPPQNLKCIEIDQSCWECLEWDNPTHKDILLTLIKFYPSQFSSSQIYPLL